MVACATNVKGRSGLWPRQRHPATKLVIGRAISHSSCRLKPTTVISAIRKQNAAAYK